MKSNEKSRQEAREACQNAKNLIGQDIDPSAKKQALNHAGANTFEVIVNEWFITKMQPKSASHKQRTQNLINTHLLPAFGSSPIKDIASSIVLQH